MTDESQLLKNFAASRDEDAFSSLVRLHLNLVFATALRQLANRALAEEVTQSVFLALARKPPTLQPNTTLAGWLYQTTLNQARQRQRSELRRINREQTAASLSIAKTEGDSIWCAALPLVDEALLQLPGPDRLAVILHYLEDRPFREVGQALGISEDAARKRINRIVDELSEWFRRHGFALPGAAVAAGLSAQGAQAAPAHLLAACAATSTASTTAAATIFMAVSKPTFFGAAALLAIGLGVVTFISTNSPPAPPSPAPNTTPVTAPNPPNRPPKSPVAREEPDLQPNRVEKSFFERINEGDESLAILSRDLAEAFLQKNQTNAQSLLAAFRVTHDLEYLRRAATNFPNDPAVLFRTLAHDAFPEQRRGWLDQFKKADPQNSLPHYLSARDHLENKNYPAAYEDLLAAASKTNFQDYLTEHMMNLEEIYLSAGYSPAQAKTLGMSAIEMPHIAQLVQTSRTVNDLVRSYQQSGDNTSAETLIRSGLALANGLRSVQDGGNLLGEMVGLVVERNFFQQLDPSKTYDFVNGPVQDRLNHFTKRESQIRADSQLFGKWIAQAPETDILIYFDRLKLYGEAAALQWLKSRTPTPAP